MKTDRARVLRLRRIERLRGLEKQALAGQAAHAEGTLAELGALAERTARLAGDYAARDDADHGAALVRLRHFALGMQALHGGARSNADGARAHADRIMAAVAAAEQRRSTASDRAERRAAELARRERQSETEDLARKLNRGPRHAAS